MSTDNIPEEDTHEENLAVLAGYRSKNVRASEEIVQRGERVLRRKGALRRMGDEGEQMQSSHADYEQLIQSRTRASVWPFLEQLGFAALDTGKNDLAQVSTMLPSQCDGKHGH